MRPFKIILLFIVAVAVAAGVIGVALFRVRVEETNRAQTQIEPFYTPPTATPTEAAGSIIRSQPLSSVTLTGAAAHRVLYVSEDASGNRVHASAMIFFPTGQAPHGGRKVVAWAHPTAGMSDKCAPSRTADPLATLPWVQQMVDLGWVVTATDYAGLGTPGVQQYLVGAAEAHDVINSVRMARNFADAKAGTTYGVFGHSQGGHAALFTGELSRSYAPELKLVGVAGAAPAAEFLPLVKQQWNTAIGWVIGTEVMISWPATYPDLTVDQVISDAARRDYVHVAEDCMTQAGAAGFAQEAAGHQVFAVDPATLPQWRRVMDEQTPEPLPKGLPVLVTQSVNDGVVISNTTALLQQKWCAAGSDLSVDWLGPLSSMPIQTHALTGQVSGAHVANWFQDRFAGRPTASSCSQTSAVTPYSAGQAASQ